MGTHLDSRITPTVATFPHTLWTDILTAKDKAHPDTEQALARLCETYRSPVYAFIRRKGKSRHDAQDLTQEFFGRLIEKDYLQSVDQSKGKFRNFLLTAVQRFLCNQWEWSQAQKRGGGVTTVSWDYDVVENQYLQEPADQLTPEKLFDRNWAEALTQKTMAQLKADYFSLGKGDILDVLEPFIAGDGTNYREAAARLNTTEGAARQWVHRIRHRYRELLRAAIAETVDSEAAVDEELRALYAALGG